MNHSPKEKKINDIFIYYVTQNTDEISHSEIYSFLHCEVDLIMTNLFNENNILFQLTSAIKLYR